MWNYNGDSIDAANVSSSPKGTALKSNSILLSERNTIETVIYLSDEVHVMRFEIHILFIPRENEQS